MKRSIIYFKDYFKDFFLSLNDDVRDKVTYVLRYIQQSDRWNQRFVKYIKDGLFEMRIEYQSNIYRVFFILDGNNIVVLFNGFQKKTQKTPQSEIQKALKIKSEYYASKQ
ncbi:MAG: type II toxin-antitoxin system RelE/ParE family toxin [Muribaculum sp.]|nr:type II toxin-antitoxin system RelE/ParE family toxin [Muribaculum sp.]